MKQKTFSMVGSRFAEASAAAVVLLLLISCAPARAQTFGADFASDYGFVSLGLPPGVSGPLGGINFLDSDTLLVGGNANASDGAIYMIDIARDAENHITGFNGSATMFSTAANIDGGLDYHPDSDVLFYTTYSNNMLGQILTGSSTPDKLIDLTSFGVSSSVGTLTFVPDGFAGAGQLKIASYSASTWHTATIAPDGGGTYDITGVSPSVPVTGGPEGIVYIRGGSTGFTNDSVLIAEWSADRVGAYEIDANGDPILGTRRDFMSSLSGAEGAVIDPLTGDFLFSTFGGGDQVLVVSGFDVPAALGTGPGDGGNLFFGYVRIGDSGTMDLTVSNVGGVGSTLSGSTEAAGGNFSGPDPDEPFELLAGESVDQSFTFSPTEPGFMQDPITVNTSAGSHDITLQGIGVGPVLGASVDVGEALDAGLASGPGAMGLIELVIANNFTGNVGDDTMTALSLLDYTITGPDADRFTLITPLGVVMAGDDLTLQIKFTPDVDGSFEAQFNLLTDLGAAYGQAGQTLTWDLLGAAENVPAPAMLGPCVIAAAMLVRRRR